MWDQYFKQDSDERRVINEEIEKLKTEKTSLMVCITVCALAQNLLLQDFGVNWFSLQPSAYSFHNPFPGSYVLPHGAHSYPFFVSGVQPPLL